MGSKARRAQIGGVGLVALVALGLAASDAFGGKSKRTSAAKRRTSLQIARIELGRRLFFDPMASAQGRTSCVACHDPSHGYSDPRVQSVDESGLTPRHSQPILDSGMNPSAHWDGEFSGVEDLVENRLGRVQVYYGNVFTPPLPPRPTTPVPPSGPRTALRGRPGARGPAATPSAPNNRTPAVPAPTVPGPGVTFPPPSTLPTSTPPNVPSLPPVARTARTALNQAAAKRIQASGRYDEAFKAAFGSSKVSLERVASAIGAYCDSIESTEAPFDRFAKGDKSAISDSAQRGLELFKGRAGCVQCHTMEGDHPLFTDFKFHNTGLSWSAARRGENPLADAGRLRLTSLQNDNRAFKTPTLRDVAVRGPYMHDGSISSLEELVLYYAKGGSDDPRRSDKVDPFEASDRDVADLVAFLRTLTGDERPGKAWHAWKVRPKQSKLRFLGSDGKPLAGLPVRLLPAGDVVPVEGVAGTSPIELETDDRGYVTYEPAGSTHHVVQVDGGRMSVLHPLLPDTLRKATLRMAVAGKVRLSIVVPGLAYAPESLHLHSQEVQAYVNSLRSAPVQRLARGQQLEAPNIDRFEMVRIGTPVKVGESVVARYEAWLPDALEGRKLRIMLPAMRTNDPAKLFVQFGDEQELRVDFTRGAARK